MNARHLLTASLLVFALLTGCASLPPGRRLSLGSTDIAWTLGGSADGPTVVLQSGHGDGMSPWAAVLQGLAPQARVFAYDRPGYGGSPATATERTPCAIAAELHAALRAAGLPPPYLLVGHSLGGQYQVAFARLYPDDVAGLLLLDPTHPSHWQQMQARAPGVAAMVSGLRTLSFTPTMRAEFDAQGQCLTGTSPLVTGRFPIRLLTRTQHAAIEPQDFQAMAHELEQDWLRLLPGGSLTPVPGASHYIQRDQPAVVVREVLALLRPAR